MPARTKDRIILAAIQLFSEKGYEFVSMREIAEAVGITGGSLYNHFSGKEHLLDTVIDFINSHIRYPAPTEAEIRARLARETPAQILESYATIYHTDLSDAQLQIVSRKLLYKNAFVQEALRAGVGRCLREPPTCAIQTTLDILAGLGAIPPCKSWVLARLWVRVHLVYSFWASHGDEQVFFAQAQSMSHLFIQMAVKGIRPLDAVYTPRPTASPSPFPSRIKSTHERIIQAAGQLISEQGAAGTSMRQIAYAAGVQAGSLYNYFSSKEDILKEIYGRISHTHQDSYPSSASIFHEYLSTGDREVLLLSLAGIIQPVNREATRKAFRILFREQYHNPTVRDFFMSAIDGDRDAVAQAVDEMILAKAIPPCDSRQFATAYVYSLCSLSVTTALQEHYDSRADLLRFHVAELLTSYLLYGFINEA